MNRDHDKWARKHIKPEEQMRCIRCKKIVRTSWLRKGDHKGLCGPCLTKENK